MRQHCRLLSYTRRNWEDIIWYWPNCRWNLPHRNYGGQRASRPPLVYLFQPRSHASTVFHRYVNVAASGADDYMAYVAVAQRRYRGNNMVGIRMRTENYTFDQYHNSAHTYIARTMRKWEPRRKGVQPLSKHTHSALKSIYNKREPTISGF